MSQTARCLALVVTFSTLAALASLLGLAEPAIAGVGFADSPVDSLDAVPPVVEIDSPHGGELLRGLTSADFTWTVSELYNQGSLARVRLAGNLADSLYVPAGVNPYTWAWEVPDTLVYPCHLEVTGLDLFGNATTSISESFIIVLSITDVPAKETTSLAMPYPNPFNPSTEIHCRLEAPGRLSLDVYDLQGRRVRHLARRLQPAGEFRFTWDGTNDRQRRVAGGTYLIRMSYEGDGEQVTRIRKVVMLP